MSSSESIGSARSVVWPVAVRQARSGAWQGISQADAAPEGLRLVLAVRFLGAVAEGFPAGSVVGVVSGHGVTP